MLSLCLLSDDSSPLGGWAGKTQQVLEQRNIAADVLLYRVRVKNRGVERPASELQILCRRPLLALCAKRLPILAWTRMCPR